MLENLRTNFAAGDKNVFLEELPFLLQYTYNAFNSSLFSVLTSL